MTEELENKLYSKFPRMFRGRSMSIKDNLMPFGIECDDGWFKLIWNLCSSIQMSLDRNGDSDFIITQIKEKLGGLSFYYNGGTDNIYCMVSYAMARSYSICEICGKRGAKNRRVSGWLKTECDKHYEDRRLGVKTRKASEYVKAILKSMEILERERDIERRKSNE